MGLVLSHTDCSEMTEMLGHRHEALSFAAKARCLVFLVSPHFLPFLPLGIREVSIISFILLHFSLLCHFGSL